MITEYRQSKIGGICLAYVAGMFADFINPKNRGPTFTWHKFADMCVKQSKDWLFVHLTRVTEEEYEYARGYTQSKAESMVNRAGILEEQSCS